MDGVHGHHLVLVLRDMLMNVCTIVSGFVRHVIGTIALKQIVMVFKMMYKNVLMKNASVNNILLLT